MTVLFSPKDDCTRAICDLIGGAKQNVRVQAYRLTSLPIARAIAEAHRRGVSVEIILDKAQQSPKYSDATYYHNAGIAVLIDDDHAIAHNKIIVIDDRVVITGSFNFTQAAESSNAENVVILQDLPTITKGYLSNFAEHAEHSSQYRPPRRWTAGRIR